MGGRTREGDQDNLVVACAIAKMAISTTGWIFFFCQLDKSRHIQEQEISVEELPSSDWPASISMGHFLD